MFELFSFHLRKTIERAGLLAFSEKEKKIEPKHLSQALFSEKGSVGINLLKRFPNIYPSFLQAKINPTQNLTRLDSFILQTDNKFSNLPLSEKSKEILRKACIIAFQYQHFFVGTEHLLCALFSKEKDKSSENLKEDLKKILGEQSKFYQFLEAACKTKKQKEESILDFFCKDLTSFEIVSSLDPVFCREKEIERIISILSRRTKNNPVLIGEAGVGKTAIVEGLAQRITKEEVPPFLLNKRILCLDLPLLVSETAFKGEFEARIKHLINEVKNQGNIILFIDEIHNIIGAGSIPGLLDVANILKPVLSRGEIQCIGATTLSEYKRYIEKDEALERRFQKIIIEEPSLEEAKKMLLGLKENYERHHHLTITPEAISAACLFSTRFLQDRFLPDKAIDLIDEAAARLSLEKMPSHFIKAIKKTKNLFEEARREKEQALIKEDLKQAEKFQQLEKELSLTLEKFKQEEEKFLESLKKRIKLEEKDIAKIVSEITKIPFTDLIEEKKKISDLEKIIEKEIIGQKEVVKEVSSVIKRFYSGMSNPQRPIGSFIFLGPSGVGKTYLGQILAKHLFRSSRNLVKLDMSEFSEAFNISRLIGSPPGYVGFGEGGRLTEAVRRNPYSLILLDEIEKAHPDVFNLLLQILEDGNLTDAAGKRIDFKNTLIIMTSNIGLEELNKKAEIGFRKKQESSQENYQETKEKILEEVNSFFKPEFLNRIDKILVFRPLDKKDFEKILDLQLKELEKRISDQKIYLEIDKEAKKYFLEKKIDPRTGCRNLRKAIEDLIELPLAEKILKEEIKKQDRVKIKLEKGEIEISLK